MPGETVVDGHDPAHGGVGAPELLHHEAVGDRVEPHAAELLGERAAEEADLRQLGDDSLVHALAAIPVAGVRDDLPVAELAGRAADQLLFRRESEVHARILSHMPKLTGKVAIVTGAGRGIGRGHALALADAGAKLVVNDLGGSLAGEGNDLSPAQQVVEEIQAAGGEAIANGANVADFTQAGEMVQAAIDTFGRLDILVNNAGILRDRMLINMTEEEWDSVIAVHLKGHFAPTRHAAAYWRERSKAGDEVHGRVINTSSPSGVFGNIGQTNYGAAKAGIAGFTIIAAQELERYGVTVNCLAPNARTRMTEETFDMGAPAEGFDPLDPANMSPLIVALSADEAQGITGQVFHVWGGAINALVGWSAGELFESDEKWDADALLGELVARFPDGVSPPGMMAGMQAAGGRSLRAQ